MESSILMILALVGLIILNVMGAGSAGASGDTIVFYVSPEGSDDWSGTLDKPNDSGTDGPFATVARARDAVREVIADGMAGDVEVLLRGGEHYIDETLTFDESDSGRDGFEVVYKAYPGEKPVLYAGRAITGWEPYEGDIYKAQVDEGWVFHTLAENGVRSVKARYPNEGYNQARPYLPDDESYQRFSFDPADFPEVADPSGLQVFIWPGGPHGHWNWFTDLIPVASVDEEKNVITLEERARYIIGAGGSRYYVQGAMELLDHPGEFFLDEETSTLYYWPRETPIDDQTITAPVTKRAVGFTGSSPDAPVHDIRFEGIEVAGTDFQKTFIRQHSDHGENQYPGEDGAIYLENAERIAITGCHIHNTGMHGVYLNRWAQENVISNNLIEDIGFSGVLLNHDWISTDLVNKANTVTNNYIHHTGRLVGHGTGIQIVQSAENTITHNLIHNTSRYAISLKAPRPGTLRGKVVLGIRVTEDNVSDFILTRNNLIAFNDMSRANMDSQDTGVIESWGVAYPGNVIDNNRIHNSDIPFSFGFGVYMDDASDGYIITNNIIHDLQRNETEGTLGGTFMIKGIGNRIENNIAAINAAEALIRTFAMADEANRELIFERNIAYQSGDIVYLFTNWADDRFTSADYNLFYNFGNRYRIIIQQRESYPHANPPFNLKRWVEILDGKYDQHSIVDEKPAFMDAEARDFRLRYDSPAHDLGFEEIDGASMGLTAGFPYADLSEPLNRLFISSDTDAHSATVRLAQGESAQLWLMARTVTGYVADLTDAEIAFISADETVASVDDSGAVTAKAPGVAEITASATQDGVTVETSVFVVVE
jgi:parallel beta-helix repeat protein